MKIGDVMMRDVELVAPQETVQRAAQIMADLDAGSVPVGEERSPVGILTDRDIIIRLVAPGGDPRATTVGEIMSRELVTCREEDDARHMAEVMEQRHIRRMPVIDASGLLVGMVNLGDILRRVAAEAGGEVSEAAAEAEAKHPRERHRQADKPSREDRAREKPAPEDEA